MTMYEYNGIKGIRNIAKHAGLSRNVIEHRLKKGWTIKDAVETPARNKNDYVYKGVKGMEAIAKAQGIGLHKLKYRVNKMGMTIQQAVRDAKKDEIDRPVPKEPVRMKFTKDSSCPKPHYSPLQALALGLITKGQYDEATKQ